MQKTLYEFCASQGRDSESSTDSSLSLKSSGAIEDISTGNQLSTGETETCQACDGACCETGHTGPNQPRSQDVLEATTTQAY